MSEAKENRPNWFRLSDGRYLVRTQAGFNHAVNHFCKLWDIEDEERRTMEGFPKSYPSVCTFHYNINILTLRVSCYHVNKHLEFLQTLIKELEGQ